MQTYLEDLNKSHRPGCFWKFDKCSGKKKKKKKKETKKETIEKFC